MCGLTVAARADRLEEAIKLELVFLPKELSTVTSPTNTISFRNLRTDAISSRLDFEILGLNVVFKIPMYPSTGTLATGYTDLIGLETTVLAACIIQLDE
jgi:hypothetical protein